MSTFGTIFRVTTFGESHCKGVGAIIDGVPPRMCGVAVDPDKLLYALIKQGVRCDIATTDGTDSYDA